MSLKTAQNKALKCTHCGEPCVDELIQSQGENFCCEGCKMVYEILLENDLDNFYCVADSPGVNKKKNNSFEYLKEESFANSLLDFKNDEISKVRFFIPAIHCSACIWLLEKLYKLNSGIVSSRVDFNKKTVIISFKHNDLSLYELVKLLDSIAYTPDIQLENKKTNPSPYRRIWLQIGIAGFVFGNSMLFSLPEYFGLDILNEDLLTKIFPYLNALLAIPVLFFSAQDYFKSAWGVIRQKQINMDVPISIGIITLFIYSYYIIFIQSGLGYLDSLSGLVFFLLLGKYYQQKTFDHLRFDRDIKSFFPLSVSRLKGRLEEQVLLNNILPSDILKIRNEEIIPADSLLISDSASIDYSFVTGESLPEIKQKEDLIYAGGRLKGSAILVQVKKRPSQSYLNQLWDDESIQSGAKAAVQSTADKISKYFTGVVLSIAFIAFLSWLFIGSFENAITAFTTVLIVACPCALALATPVTLGFAMRILAKTGFFVKNTQAVENLSKIDTIVFDKTGTLTYSDKAEVVFEGNMPEHKVLAAIKTLFNQSKHPLSRIIYNWLPSYPVQNIEDYKEISGQGISAKVNGQIIKLGKKEFVDHQLKSDNNTVNRTQVYINVDGLTYGCFNVKHVFRENIGDLFNSLTPEYELSLLSGDISTEKDYLKKWIKEENLYFEQLPGDKKEFILKSQAANQKVLMAGDGLNDSAALKSSDFGLAITESTSQFSPACDGILLGNKIQQLPKIMKFSKSAFKLVIAGFIVSFLYNIIGLSLAVQALLSPVIAAILMPISSFSVVLLATVGTRYYAKKYFFNTQNKNEI
ncbi:heavy metal translocating P-type ATPase metal-binding domain-containing protein [Marivirga arenosa]|uniref:Heavy metal translocating P-type ATPase metal-binding domain-containing protein n=1 Tax=Marivirga arenosa TaxID=3059076 RepID=A0AA51N5L6_9BACT|nr:heavy metal translocating P-type ATPase metal-binding domain-containing protein [Marivirga sp. ABR2-2]WMN06070.1 heavy metal translocating P-type ATPase metal-binding domain-containing protein [Marivirga sp. ABR2-2]